MNSHDSKIHLSDGQGALHERLADSISGMIGSGRLEPGDRLPTQREISSRAGVAIGTVTKAIELLARRGIVRGEVGRGTFVSPMVASRPSRPIDLTLNIPPLMIDESIFVEAGELAARRAAALPNAGLYDLAGTSEQRAVVSDWLSRDGLELSPESLLLCVGAQQAIHLAFADLRRHSGMIASEAATFSGAIAAAAHLGMGWSAVDHDVEGMIPEHLDEVLRTTECRTVYTTPVCQNPLGFEVGDERRRAILKVCQEHDAYIVEDDIYALYATKTRDTYKSLAPDRVYYLTSISKCLTPLVRFGVLAPPTGRIAALTRDLRAQVYGAPQTSLEFGRSLIELGAVSKAAEALREEARVRVEMAAKHLDLLDIPMPCGAPHIWLPMSAVDAEKLVRRASERGVRLTPPDATAISPDGSGGVRLCILAPAERDDLARALRTVSDLLANPVETVV